MTENHIQLLLKPKPYRKRSAATFWLTMLPYVLVTLMLGLRSEPETFLNYAVLFALVFIVDYNRRLKGVQYALVSMESNEESLTVSYYDKEEMKSETIPWSNLRLSQGNFWSKNPNHILHIQDEHRKVASFYRDSNLGEKELKNLYKALYQLKQMNTRPGPFD